MQDSQQPKRNLIEGRPALVVIDIQEVHRPDLVDSGHELDGSEDIHCIETNPDTEIAIEEIGFLPND